MKRFMTILLSLFCVCSCDNKAIKSLKSEVETLQNELYDLRSLVHENDSTIGVLALQKDSLEKGLEKTKIIISQKEYAIDSLYKIAYPSMIEKPSLTGKTKRVNSELEKDPRFKIKRKVVF